MNSSNNFSNEAGLPTYWHNILYEQHFRIRELEDELFKQRQMVELLKNRIQLSEQQQFFEQKGQQSTSRYWTDEEHERYLVALAKFGPKDVKMISEYVGTRSPTQVRTHTQKYFLRLEREKKRQKSREAGANDMSQSTDDSENDSSSARSKNHKRRKLLTKKYRDILLSSLSDWSEEEYLQIEEYLYQSGNTNAEIRENEIKEIKEILKDKSTEKIKYFFEEFKEILQEYKDSRKKRKTTEKQIQQNSFIFEVQKRAQISGDSTVNFDRKHHNQPLTIVPPINTSPNAFSAPLTVGNQIPLHSSSQFSFGSAAPTPYFSRASPSYGYYSNVRLTNNQQQQQQQPIPMPNFSGEMFFGGDSRILQPSFIPISLRGGQNQENPQNPYFSKELQQQTPPQQQQQPPSSGNFTFESSPYEFPNQQK